MCDCVWECVCVSAERLPNGVMAKTKEWKARTEQSDLIHMPTFRLESIFMACTNAMRASSFALFTRSRCVCGDALVLSMSELHLHISLKSPQWNIILECANKQATISRLDITTSYRYIVAQWP